MQVGIKPHDIFKRDGRDLYCEMPISFATAALGGELEVPTLEGRVKLKIPEGTQTGRVFRLRGKGVVSVHDKRPGDLLCMVIVETPVKLNDEQRELLRNFDESLLHRGEKHSPRARSWLDGVKDFFEALKS